MNRSPEPSPSVAGEPFDLSVLLAAGAIDVVPGQPPVPITVWRVPGPDSPLRPAADGGITAGAAHLLVGQYTRPGDTVVSVGPDPDLQGCAGANGCTYRAVYDVAGLTRLAGAGRHTGRVRLLALRWPPRDCAAGSADALFVACRWLLTRDGVAAVAITPVPPGGTFVAPAGPLIRAARAAGLGWLQHIVVVTAVIDGDQLAVPAAAADPATLRSARSLTAHVDLLVFVLRHTRRARGTS